MLLDTCHSHRLLLVENAQSQRFVSKDYLTTLYHGKKELHLFGEHFDFFRSVIISFYKSWSKRTQHAFTLREVVLNLLKGCLKGYIQPCNSLITFTAHFLRGERVFLRWSKRSWYFRFFTVHYLHLWCFCHKTDNRGCIHKGENKRGNLINYQKMTGGRKARRNGALPRKYHKMYHWASSKMKK